MSEVKYQLIAYGIGNHSTTAVRIVVMLIHCTYKYDDNDDTDDDDDDDDKCAFCTTESARKHARSSNCLRNCGRVKSSMQIDLLIYATMEST